MPDKLTFTGPIGPGNSVTSLVFADVKELRYDLDKFCLQVVETSGKVTDLDIYASTTVTHTISSRVHTIAVSQ